MMSNATEVLFAPDWRAGVPYQRLLADALAGQQVRVRFLNGYRRVMPLWRALKSEHCDLFHLHWPEAYFPQMNDGFDWFRRARFSTDLTLATRHAPLVLTAHNLHTHNRPGESFENWNTRSALRRASAVIAHSEAAKAKIVTKFGVASERCHVIPHGDLSVALGAPESRETARAQLGLGDEKQCLIFGAVEPYKGIEEMIEFWRELRPGARLTIAGKPISPAYAAQIESCAASVENVATRLQRLSDEELRLWLSAMDCVIFNYRTIFTSGAACLARSWGVPLLVPARLKTVDLREPHPLVFRFSDKNDFAAVLRAALETPSDYAAAQPWREATSWESIAEKTAAVYRTAQAGSAS